MHTAESPTGSHLAIPQVVKVFATTQEPDYRNPWRQKTTEQSGGSGVVIGPGEILTGAHVVADATFLQVQRMADPEKATARVKAVCHDSDLALLAVEDERFLRGTSPVPLGELCSLRDKVLVAGFPMGGQEISITEGVVSRLEVQYYFHSGRRLLAATVDAAVNPGNSGGPVLREGKVVGIAFQKIMFLTEGMGYVVPTPLIRRFLDAVAHNRPLDVPDLGFWGQVMESPALRQRLGLDAEESGVMVMSVQHGGSACGQLVSGDVVLEIDGHRVANNATVRYRDRYRTDLDVIMSDHFVGDPLDLKVLRGGVRKQLRLTLQPCQRLVPGPLYDRPPTYFIYCGVVFQQLVQNMLGDKDELPHHLHTAAVEPRTERRQELVVISSILDHDINLGYQDMVRSIVESVNGVVPRTMADFVRLVESSVDWVEIVTTYHAVIVLDARQARAASREILERYRVARDRSPDLPPPRGD